MIPYTIILIAVLIISPFAIGLAEKQDKRTKSRLKNIFLFLLLAQIALASYNWQLLLLFLAISLLQFVLFLKKPSQTVVVINFINTLVLFITMARLDRPIGNLNNLAAIAAAFVVLINNVLGLLLINREKKLRLTSVPVNVKLLLAAFITLIIAAMLAFSLAKSGAKAKAIATVSALPEVQEYLRTVPAGIVALDHEDKETNSFVIHVYEVIDNHTATFNWYEINQDTGTVSALIP